MPQRLPVEIEAREIQAPNLLIWSQTRCRCAIAPMCKITPLLDARTCCSRRTKVPARIWATPAFAGRGCSSCAPQLQQVTSAPHPRCAMGGAPRVTLSVACSRRRPGGCACPCLPSWGRGTPWANAPDVPNARRWPARLQRATRDGEGSETKSGHTWKTWRAAALGHRDATPANAPLGAQLPLQPQPWHVHSRLRPERFELPTF